MSDANPAAPKIRFHIHPIVCFGYIFCMFQTTPEPQFESGTISLNLGRIHPHQPETYPHLNDPPTLTTTQCWERATVTSTLLPESKEEQKNPNKSVVKRDKFIQKGIFCGG